MRDDIVIFLIAVFMIALGSFAAIGMARLINDYRDDCGIYALKAGQQTRYRYQECWLMLEGGKYRVLSHDEIKEVLKAD